MGGKGQDSWGGIVHGIVRTGKGLGIVHDDTKDQKSNDNGSK